MFAVCKYEWEKERIMRLVKKFYSFPHLNIINVESIKGLNYVAG